MQRLRILRANVIHSLICNSSPLLPPRRPYLSGLPLLISTTGGDQLDLLAAEFDLELITGLEIEQGGVGLADQ